MCFTISSRAVLSVPCICQTMRQVQARAGGSAFSFRRPYALKTGPLLALASTVAGAYDEVSAMTKREQSRRRVATGALLGLAAVSALAATVSTPVIPPARQSRRQSRGRAEIAPGQLQRAVHLGRTTNARHSCAQPTLSRTDAGRSEPGARAPAAAWRDPLPRADRGSVSCS